MHIKRRTFLQATVVATAAVVIGKQARAQAAPLPPLFISVEANQAWDTTTSVDPHGNPAFSLYTEDQILTSGGLRVAPFEGTTPFSVRRLRTADTVDFFATFGGFNLGAEISTHLPVQLDQRGVPGLIAHKYYTG